MNFEISSVFPYDWSPHLQRREPADLAQILRDEVRDLYATIPEVRFVVAQRSGDVISRCDVWLYFEMEGWNDELMEEIVIREFLLRDLEEDPATEYDFHYIPIATIKIPGWGQHLPH